MRIVEVNATNEGKYLDKIANLEVKVLNKMEQNGQIGQLFITGAEDISGYIHSENNSVYISVDEDDSVEAAVYITQGQSLYTYNDVTKYFKESNEYKEYVKNQYANEMQYKKAMLDAYKNKIDAYMYASQKILEEHPEYSSIEQFFQVELNSKSKFDEKSELREKLNSYMYEYIKELQSFGNKNAIRDYERFYLTTYSDIKNEVYGDAKKVLKNPIVISLEKNLQIENEHERVSEKSRPVIHDKKANFDVSKYFTANPRNSIEIDTYITDPDKRNSGIARAIVYQGIKKHINNLLKNKKNNEVFLCSTLHPDNVSSKYVSEFFELKDNLFVKRREGRDREVHITKIARADINCYLRHMAEKLAVLYGYNPEHINITKDIERKVLKEQLSYEKKEFHRLNKVRRHPIIGARTYAPNVKMMHSKIKKIADLKTKLKCTEER